MTYAIEIAGMHCAHCARAVESALSGLAGVSSVSIDLSGQTAYADASKALDEGAVQAAVDDAGFGVISIQMV